MAIVKESKGYTQLLRIQINKARYLVISRQLDNRISMAQQVRISDQGIDKEQYLFVKNSFVFESDEAFEEFREELYKLDISKK